jgi:hypothetical protein
MNKLILILTIFSFSISNAQISNLGINYQAQIRNTSGVLIPDTQITLRYTLYPSQFSTTPVWQEEHNLTTDKYGIASAVIGKGTRTAGTVASFNLVDFALATLWIKVEIKSGASYTELSPAEPLQSVPYAKAAGNASPIPPGFIMAFGGNISKIPAGWLPCDGIEISRVIYADLYNTIGDNWGRGNNTTTFNLPDLRGQFLRGVSQQSGVDPDAYARTAKYTGGNIGDNVGGYQDMQIQSHNHSYHESSKSPPYSGGGGSFLEGNFPSSTGNSGGSETRPKNVSVFYLIKF